MRISMSWITDSPQHPEKLYLFIGYCARKKSTLNPASKSTQAT